MYNMLENQLKQLQAIDSQLYQELNYQLQISGGSAFRLLSDTFINNSTLALNNNNMFDSFNNVSKTIYFYAVTSVKGTEITIVKC